MIRIAIACAVLGALFVGEALRGRREELLRQASFALREHLLRLTPALKALGEAFRQTAITTDQACRAMVGLGAALREPIVHVWPPAAIDMFGPGDLELLVGPWELIDGHSSNGEELGRLDVILEAHRRRIIELGRGRGPE